MYILYLKMGNEMEEIKMVECENAGFTSPHEQIKDTSMALKHVKYHVLNELPVQVRCTILDAWGWCTGMTQRDGMGREEGGGFMMGNTCIPVADSF